MLLERHLAANNSSTSKFLVSIAGVQLRNKMVSSTENYVIVRPLSTVEYTSIVASVIHSRQWSN